MPLMIKTRGALSHDRQDCRCPREKVIILVAPGSVFWPAANLLKRLRAHGTIAVTMLDPAPRSMLRFIECVDDRKIRSTLPRYLDRAMQGRFADNYVRIEEKQYAAARSLGGHV